jgi:hypothetical protein
MSQPQNLECYPRGQDCFVTCIIAPADYVCSLMNENNERLSDAQRDKLCDMIYHAFLEIRILGWAGKANQAADLADAFHNLPKDMWTENFSLEDYRDTFLKAYQEKYPDQSNRNYVAMINQIILMGNPDYSAN